MPRKRDEKPYSKVVREMWGDKRFCALSALPPSGQSLWLYLLTGPHCTVIPGLLPGMGLGTLADRLKWPYKAIEKHWGEIADAEMAAADWAAGVIWLPNGIIHNPPANPNVVVAWRAVPLPQCALVVRALGELRARLSLKEHAAWLEAFDDGFRRGFPEVFADGARVKVFPKVSGKGVPEGVSKGVSKGVPEGVLEGVLEGVPKGVGETGTGTGSGTEIPPYPPLAGGRVSTRKASQEERDWALRVIRASRSGCPHADDDVEDRCPDQTTCAGRLVMTRRRRELEGMQQEARA